MADTKILALIQEDRPHDFNHVIENYQGSVDLSGSQFRGYDLRKFNLRTANMRDCYFRHSDLRGVDLSEAQIAGSSFKEAKVSGVMFPISVSADEIRLSLEYGTRIRELPEKSV